jgi:chromosome segregation ATPase
VLRESTKISPLQSKEEATMAVATSHEKLSELERTMQELARVRDELRLQAHLFGAEAREDWVLLEPRWRELERKVDRLRGTLGEVAGDVWEAVKLLADELASSYRRIRRVI